MLIKRAYRYELKPNISEQILLAKHAGVARFAYNWGLSQRIELYEKDKSTTNAIEQHRILNSLKEESFLWMYEVSNGEKVSGPKPLQRSIKKLRRLSRQHSRKEKGSKNRKKSALRLARVYRKISNQRIDFHHKLSTQLAKTKSVIVVEDLDVKSMQQNSSLSKGIADASWAGFFRMLEYKTEWYGSQLIKAPKYYPSSKTCSSCHHVLNELPLHIRNWTCEKCGSNHDRDINAAKNILNTGSSPGIHACGDPSCEIGQKSISNGSLKQELMHGIFVHKL